MFGCYCTNYKNNIWVSDQISYILYLISRIFFKFQFFHLIDRCKKLGDCPCFGNRCSFCKFMLRCQPFCLFCRWSFLSYRFFTDSVVLSRIIFWRFWLFPCAECTFPLFRFARNLSDSYHFLRNSWKKAKNMKFCKWRQTIHAFPFCIFRLEIIHMLRYNKDRNYF